MSLAFESALEVLLADPNIGRDAVYIADGGTPILVRVVTRRADTVTCGSAWNVAPLRCGIGVQN